MNPIGIYLAQSVLFNMFIPAASIDAEFVFDKNCYNEGDTVILTAEYTGSGTEQYVNWFYESRIAADNRINKDTCSFDVGSGDAGYPSNMDYNCDDKAQHIYKATIPSLPQTAIGKEWGASFILTGGASTDYDKKTLKQCTSNGEGGLTREQKLGIGLGVGIPCLIAVGGVIGYCIFKHKN